MSNPNFDQIPKSGKRIMVKLKDDLLADLADPAAAEKLQEKLRSYLQTYPAKIEVMKLFSRVPPDAMNQLLERARRNDTWREPELPTCFTLEVPHGVDAQEVLRFLSASGIVQYAYIDPSGGTPSISPKENPLFAEQEYLGPKGIDVTSVWPGAAGAGFLGADGEGMNFIDIELGWTLEHEDLSDLRGQPRAQLLNGDNLLKFRRHGTMVLGITVASNNRKGSVGIAYNVGSVNVVSYQSEGSQDRPAAIALAASKLEPGDVLLLEIQLNEIPGNPPIEVAPCDFLAIRLATAAGIVVVEPAGNGGIDLDSFQMDGFRTVKRNNPQDSGAILVAAANPNRTPSNVSNFGSRVDCYAWGTGVNIFTQEFPHGTSAASAIIAGVALSVQGVAKKKRGVALEPAELRSLLSRPDLNTASADGILQDRIGVMPNLKNIMPTLS